MAVATTAAQSTKRPPPAFTASGASEPELVVHRAAGRGGTRCALQHGAAPGAAALPLGGQQRPPGQAVRLPGGGQRGGEATLFEGSASSAAGAAAAAVAAAPGGDVSVGAHHAIDRR